jgi:hypothetical protein
LNLTGSLEDSQRQKQPTTKKQSKSEKHMKTITRILGLAGLALSATAVHAQVFNYTSGDLILDISKPGFADLEADLGSLSSLTAAAQAAGGTVQLNAYNVSSQLLGNFGTVNGLTFTVFGTSSVASVADFFTDKRVNPAVQNSLPADFSASTTTTISTAVKSIIGVGSTTGILPWSLNNPADPVNNTATVAIIPTSGATGANSYTVKNTTTGGGNISGFVGGIANTTPASFASGSIVSDLFEYDPLGAGHKAVYEGDFTFNSDGSLDFTTAFVAAPEPGTYGLLAAGGLLLMTLRNQLKPKQA